MNPIPSIEIPDPRRKVIFTKPFSFVPRAQRTAIFNRKKNKLQDDAISKDFDILYENGLFSYNDQEMSLKMILDKITVDNNQTDSWTNEIFNLDVIQNKSGRISVRKVSLESLKADTETSKSNKATVNSIISM